ncbi:hypothetical protein Tco_0736590 [Tanacetum coccineum]
MSSITAQQTKLDLELVPTENRLDIGKCNGRIPHSSLTRINDQLYLNVFRYIFQIFLRVQKRDFDPLPSEEDTVSFLRELGHIGEINSSMCCLSIRCINPGELLLLLSTEVYLERLVVLTSFVSLELKSFGERISKSKRAKTTKTDKKRKRQVIK